MDPFAFPTGLLDRRDPAVALQLVSTLVTVAVRSESHDQARNQRRTGPRQTSKEAPVRVAAHELLNTLFENCDLAAQSCQQRHQAASDDGPRIQYRRIRGGGYGLVDGLEALLHAFLTTAVVLLKELAQSSGMRPLQFPQARPALQQIPYQGARHIPEPVKNLREIQL